MRTYDNAELTRIVNEYKARRKQNPDTHIDNCLNQPTLADAVEVAAKAVNAKGKMNHHQRRVGQAALDVFAANLKGFVKQLSAATTFDQIHDIVAKAATDRIGELVIYDTAQRIGCYKNVFPDKVYLHTGTRTGARKLLGKLKNNRELRMDELPGPLAQLTPDEVENVFCIYKDKMAGCVMNP